MSAGSWMQAIGSTLTGGGAGAAVNPYAAGIGAISGMAAGGPSSAESGGDDTLGGGNITIGGNGSQTLGNKGAASEVGGVPVSIILGGMGLVGLVLVVAVVKR